MLSTAAAPRPALCPALPRRQAGRWCPAVTVCGAKKREEEVVVLTKRDLKRALRTAVAVALDQLLVALDTDASVLVDPLPDEPKKRKSKKKAAAGASTSKKLPLKLTFPPPSVVDDAAPPARAASAPAPPPRAAPPPPPGTTLHSPLYVEPAPRGGGAVHPQWHTLSPVAISAETPLDVAALDDADVAPVAYLHSSLLACGYNVADDDEVDAILFGPATSEAVATLQACCGLPDTGMVDASTWTALVTETLLASGTGRDDAVRHAAATLAAPPPWAALTHGTVQSHFHAAPAPATSSPASLWPSLRRDDGGAPVALLHALLMVHGYYTDDEEASYWTFGSGTDMALRTFQACAGLVDTGVTCGATWRALVSKMPELDSVDEDDTDVRQTVGAVRAWLDKSGCDAEQLLSAGLPTFHALLQAVVDGSRDLSGDGREGSVWLLGEQRWSTPHK